MTKLLNKNKLWCSYIVVLFVIICRSVQIEGQNCRTTGYFRASSPPSGQCTSNCCVQNTVYFTFQCSPSVTSQTPGILSLRSFQNNQSKCDNVYHFDKSMVVGLSTGWYDGGSRCGKVIVISGNGKTVKAKVVDECDSTKGCEAEEGYHPPCGYNIVAASKAVWKALGVPQSQLGQLNITWADT
ncbi:putative ripening-related protein 1 [Amaranthus tricolor]|uniref:putative ripening-related protein 1 n=1 Tax=Amaranthus tricolor TaxID=29722 RepID=UPI00258974BD|nr:putative ripening-related protein 1 [Amaranthus tricolor]